MDKSKTTTFYEWLEKTTIEIPMLQRDYAQGRPDTKTTVLREYFVSDLLDAVGGKKKVHLDFIYGPEHDSTFQPLDGQQRLTTLFLLHWYLAVKSGKLDDAKETLEKFRYKVRVSTQEFIDAILNPKNVNGEILSKENLRDAKWYFTSWDYDPSIQGMVNMIDTINTKLKEGFDCSSLWKTLSGGDAPITFTVLNMEKFGLGDELYMRMNARGLALSDFENFKAWLHSTCEEKNLEDDGYFSKPKDDSTLNEKHWGYKLDREWTAFLWQKSGYDPKAMNDTFLRFFQLATLNAYAGRYKGNVEPKKENKKEYKKAELFRNNISRLADGKEYIPNDEYQKIYKLMCGETLKKLFVLFDFFAEEGRKNTNSDEDWLNITLEPVPFFFKERETPISLLYKGKLTYPQRVLFHALQQFIIRDGFLRESDEHKESLVAWMRVIRNLVLNSTIDAPAPFARAIQSIDKLILKNEIWTKTGVLKYLVSESCNITGFSADQIAEEQHKAKLMLGDNGENWEPVIVEAENHLLFRGQIGFLFQDTVPSEPHTELSEVELPRVQRRWKNAAQFFIKSGVAELFAQDSILMRAYISRMNQWGQLLHIPFDNGIYTWREVILKLKEGKYWKLAPLLSLLEIDPSDSLEQLKEWIKEDSKISELEAPRKRVHHELYKTLLLVHTEEQSYLRGDPDDKSLSKFIYYLMPYNAKADRKKVALGMKRNEILAELIKNEKISSNGQLDDLSFFRCSSASFCYKEKTYRWDWHDQIYLEGREDPLVLQEQGVTEEMLTGKKLMELLNGFAPSQQT